LGLSGGVADRLRVLVGVGLIAAGVWLKAQPIHANQ
jgi:hypothetical protein